MDQAAAGPVKTEVAGQVPQQKSVLDPVGIAKEKVMKKFESPKRKIKGKVAMVVVGILVILAGVITGWFLSGYTAKGGTKGMTVAGGVIKDEEGKEAGVEDESLFPDEAEGILKEGGIDGEGTHYLDREGDLGPGKNVYLFSTMVNLGSFVDKKVKVWGQTVSGQKAGWLMEVGKIKVLE